MEEKNKKILVITVIIIAIIAIATISAMAYTSSKNKKENKTVAGTAETPKVVSGSTKKSEGGNSGLSSVEISSSSKKVGKLEGYNILGKIRIPKVSLECNILDEVTKRSIEIAVAQMFTTDGLNKPGNTVIYGHNYRNTLFFSRNDELEIGDKVYITDYEQNIEVEYEIYDMFETMTADTSFYARDAQATGGTREITLSTCTDDASETDRRLIILAKEK